MIKLWKLSMNHVIKAICETRNQLIQNVGRGVAKIKCFLAQIIAQLYSVVESFANTCYFSQ